MSVWGKCPQWVETSGRLVLKMEEDEEIPPVKSKVLVKGFRLPVVSRVCVEGAWRTKVVKLKLQRRKVGCLL